MDETTSAIAFVGVSSLDRAQVFYGDTLGLALREERPFALVAQLGPTMLRITAVPAVVAAPYTVAGFGVDDIASAVDHLHARGLQFTRYDGMDQDERGIWTSPGGSRVAWFADPDGNNLSLTEFAAR